MDHRTTRDDGFSLIEVMFAAFIAFFILTAIFAVLVSSSGMSKIANADTVATSLAQQVVEGARSLPYADIGVTDPASTAEPHGTLTRSEETTVQGIHFTITRDIDWFSDPLDTSGTNPHSYKRITVQVSWTGGHTTPIVSYIADTSNQSGSIPLVVWLQDVIPQPHGAAQPVLFTLPEWPNVAQVWDGSTNPSSSIGLASIQASASVTTTSGTITQMSLSCNAYAFGPVWSGSQPIVSHFPTAPLVLDLTATDQDSGQPIFKEGLNTLRVAAFTNTLGSAAQFLLVIVDNIAPSFASNDFVNLQEPEDNTARYNGSLDVTWTVPYDATPTVPASVYDVAITPYNAATQTWTSQVLGSSGLFTLAANAPSGFTPTPFSLYAVQLTPRSVRGLSGNPARSVNPANPSSAYAASAPQLSGSIFNQATTWKAPNNFRFDLNVSPPLPSAAELAAEYGGTSIKYDVYVISGATYTYPGIGDLPSSLMPAVTNLTSQSFSLQEGGTSKLYLQIEAKILDGSGAVVARLRSNVVGAVGTGPTYQHTTVLPVP